MNKMEIMFKFLLFFINKRNFVLSIHVTGVVLKSLKINEV